MTVDENPAASLGSASWAGADQYDIGDRFYERATGFCAAVKWDVLASLSSNLRNGIPCEIGEKFSIGHFNMVRQVVFVDGIRWVARLRLPEMEEVFGGREELDQASIFKVEVASMKFLRAKSSIPVPEVYSYDVNPNNDVGAPYILMEYIHGTVAAEMKAARKSGSPIYGTPDQDRKFRQQMAGIQVELSSFVFDQIGSLYHDEKTSTFFIGPEIETGKGPWTSPMDYYTDLASHALRSCIASAEPEVTTCDSFALPVHFMRLISLYGHHSGSHSSSGGLFRLTNRDFGAHNLLVNDDFDIIGVIDLDGVMAAPIEVIGQFPSLTGLDPDPPGHNSTNPFAIERMKIVVPQLEEYTEMVRRAEAGRDGSKEGESTIANVMWSDAGVVFRGLDNYACHSKDSNDRWMEAFSDLLRKHVRSKALPAP